MIGASVEKVENGTRFVADAGRTMDSLVNSGARRQRSSSGRISSATLEQTQGIGQVGQAVNELDRTTQQNAALVEESAAAAGSLSEQARRLADTVRVFKLQEPAAPVAA